MYLNNRGLEPKIDARNRRYHNHRGDDYPCELLHAATLWELCFMPNSPAAATAGQPK